MNCKEASEHISAATSVADLRANQALQVHLMQCEDCRELARDRELDELMASVPVPVSREGFAERALETAWETAHGSSHRSGLFRPGVAVAASLMLCSVLVYQVYGPQGTANLPDQTVVRAVPDVLQPVHVRLMSREALPEATITIRWDDQVALNGYSGTTSLSWTTGIAIGANELELPVIMKGGTRGDIEIRVTSGNAYKQMRFTVESDLPAATAGVSSHFEYNI